MDFFSTLLEPYPPGNPHRAMTPWPIASNRRHSMIALTWKRLAAVNKDTDKTTRYEVHFGPDGHLMAVLAFVSPANLTSDWRNLDA